MRSFSQLAGALLVVIGVVALFGTLTGNLTVGEVARILVPLLILALGAWILYQAATRPPAAAPPSGWAAPQSSAAETAPIEADAPPTEAAQTPPLEAAETPPPEATPPAGDTAPSTGTAPPTGPAAWPEAGAQPPARYSRIAGAIELVGPIRLGPLTHVETLIGQMRVDLTQASLASPETAIRVNGLIGEIRVLLPPDATAIVRASSLVGDVEVFGRLEGPFFGDASVATGDVSSTAPRVRIDAHTLIGQVAVRRARSSGD